MAATNRSLLRFLPALVFCMSAGCGDYYVTELKTRDDRIHIVIKEPVDCYDEPVYALVSGHSKVNYSQKIGLCYCDGVSRVKPDQFILLEGTTWCAIVLPVYLDADDTGEKSGIFDAVPLIVDRVTGNVYYPMGEEFYLADGDWNAVSPPESILEPILGSIRTLQSELSQRPRENRWLKR